MVFDKLASVDFERAVSKAFWHKVVTWLTGQSNALLPFDAVREHLPIKGQHYIGLQQVPITQIIGSIGRYRDFDRAFRPLQARTKDRWMSIDKAHLQQIALPPIELYKMGEVYFVKDGNHRVSVASEQGQEFIDAYVIEVEVPVPITADTRMDDLALKQEYAVFLEKTRLTELRPAAQLETQQTGQYALLLEHIDFHRWVLGEQRETEVPYPDAVISWYDQVYMPLVSAIREQGLLRDFPHSTELDLYLWMAKYQMYLALAYRDDSGVDGISPAAAKAEAARQLADDASIPLVKKLAAVMQRANWPEKLIIKQEQSTFWEQTGLAQLRPEAQVEATLPGQYDKLLEHIAVHRWYLGIHCSCEVPYEQAVGSWYDNVYLPLIEIIREQAILAHFPGRTETDLYLWIIEFQGDLRELYGSDVPLQEAAEKFVEEESE